jgi:hypothetical protein
MILLLIGVTMLLGLWAYKEHRDNRNQRGFIVIGGITLAGIATILTIVSALISIIYTIFDLTDDHLWWWF